MNVPEKMNQNVPATNDPNYNPYVAYGNAASQSKIVGHLLKFTKFGEFEAGEDNTSVPHGTELIAHMGELLIGWQRWQDSKPVEQVMGLVRENFQPPRRSELGDQDREQWEVDDNGKERDPWQLTNMLILKGVDNDELYTFATSSKGGLQAIGRLAKEYGKAMRMRPDEFPVVRLNWGSYEHSNKQYGEIRYPVFEIVGWAAREDIDRALAGMGGGGDEPPDEPEQDPEPEKKPVPQPVKKPQPAPVEKPQPAAARNYKPVEQRQVPRQAQQNRNTRF